MGSTYLILFLATCTSLLSFSPAELRRESLSLLKEGTDSSDSKKQLYALYAAGISQSEETLPLIQKAIQGKNPEKQAVALQFLPLFETTKAHLLLKELLKAQHPLIQLQALFTLAKMKHPDASTYTEAVMSRFPPQLKPLFPQFLIELYTRRSEALLRQFLYDSDSAVRLATIQVIAAAKREAFLPSLRRLATHIHPKQKEMLAVALGAFNDEESIPLLQKWQKSTDPFIQLATAKALYTLGDSSSEHLLVEAAEKGDNYALTLLAGVEEQVPFLQRKLRSPNPDTRLNAAIALIHSEGPLNAGDFEELFFSGSDKFLTEIRSPAGALTSYTLLPAHQALGKKGAAATFSARALRGALFTKAVQKDDETFFYLSDRAFRTLQIDLIPLAAKLLENHGSKEAEEILQKNAQRLGAPFARYTAQLTLLRMGKGAHYLPQIIAWAKTKGESDLVQMGPNSSFDLRGKSDFLTLTPEEETALFLEAVELFAQSKSAQEIETLTYLLRHGAPSSKILIAGVCLRTLQ